MILVDYGSHVRISVTKLRYLHVKFLECLPIQAIWCKSELPAKTGLPREERALVGTQVNENFLAVVRDRDLGVHFLNREDPMVRQASLVSIPGEWEIIPNIYIELGTLDSEVG